MNADGSLDTKFDSSKLTLPSISAVAIHSDGSIFVAGSTTTIDKESGKSITTNTIIKINSDGSLDTKFNDISKLNLSSISAMSIQDDGSILIFVISTILDEKSGQSTSSSAIIKINSDGSYSSKVETTQLNFSTISAMSIQDDGSILIAGSTTTIDKESGESTTTSTIIKLNPDGSLDTKFTTGIGFNGPIYSISIDKTNRILVIGNFTTYNQQEVQNIAVLNIED